LLNKRQINNPTSCKLQRPHHKILLLINIHRYDIINTSKEREVIKMKIVVPVEIELDIYGAADEVFNCINSCFDYDTGDYCFHITNEDVIRRNFTIDVLEEALKRMKED